MPSDSYATAFMMTMCYEQHPGAAPWDDPAVLLALQISHPNAGKKQLGLPESKSRAVHAFISAVRNRMLAARSDYIKEGDCDDGRISYVKWFRKVSLVLNTIVEHELMEADIHPTQVIAKIGKDEFPCLEYWQAWSHTLGEIVFGTSVMNLAGFVDSDAVSSVARIISYNLLRLRRQWKSARGRIGKHRQLALECMEVLNSAGPDFCLADLQAAMAAVKIWQAASLWFPQEGKHIEGHIITIEALFGTIGHSSGREEEQLPDELAGTVAKARLAASHKRMIATDLANEEQVAQTWREFVEYFVRTRTDRTTRPAVEIDLADLDLELGAIGVCTMSKYTESQLELLLGFPDGRPPHWATLRSDNPELTSWDPGSASAYTIDGPGMAPLRLLWHQMVGIAAMLDKLFTAQPSSGVPGILLADAVGVGKTAQVMGVIAALQMIFIAHEKGEETIPLLASKPHFMGIGAVPDLPHLVIFPNTLGKQWSKELKTFFKAYSLDIFRMPTSAKDYVNFFKEGGQWSQSQHRRISRVVLVAESTFKAMTKSSFDLNDTRADFPDRIRRSLPGHKDTIFGQQWCTAWIDEAHDFRGGNQGFVGAVHLRQCARVVSCLTATPLYTGPKDAINMGRMIGVQALCGVNGMTLQTERLREIARAKSSLSVKDRTQVSSLKERQMRGEDISREKDPSKGAAAITYRVIKDLQKIFDGHLIRRTTDSLRYDGKKINDALNPYTEHIIAIYLPAEEMNKLKECVDEMWAQRKTSNLADFSSHSFYSQYRVRLAYPYDKYPKFTSVEEWEKQPGTKLQTLLSILQHLLTDDSIEHASVGEQGELILPQAPIYPSGQQPARSRKILVYHEFPMMEWTIRSALSVHGINTFCINGGYSVNQRAQQVSEFASSTDPNWRVFLFSSVGVAGLNLACADTVILFDTVWSELTTVQIIGRAHRLGQKKEVHVYKLAALGTTDVIMSSLARSKDEMLNALVSQNTDPDLEKLLRHEVDDANISDDDGEASSLGLEPPIRQGRRKRATKAKKEGDAKAPLRAVGTGKLKAKRSGKGTHKDPIDLVDNGALLSGPSTTSMGSADSPTHQDDKKPAPLVDKLGIECPPVPVPGPMLTDPASSIRQITPDRLLRLASHHSVLEVSDHPADQLPWPETQCNTHIEPPHPSKPSIPSLTPSQRSPTPFLGPGPMSMTASSPPLDLSKAQVDPVRDGAQVHGTCPPCPPASSPPQPTSPLPSPPLGSIAALGSILVLPSPLGSPAYSTSGTQLAPARVEPACEPSMSPPRYSPNPSPSPPPLDFPSSPSPDGTQFPSGPPLPALLLNSSQVSESSPTRNRTPRPRPRPTNITSLGKRPAVDSPPMHQTPRPTNITSLGKRPAADSLPNPRPSQRPWATFDRSASLHGNPPSDDDDDEDDGRGFRLIQQTRAAIVRAPSRPVHSSSRRHFM